MGGPDGDAQNPIGETIEQFLRESLRFAPEEEGIAGLEIGIVQGGCPAGAEQMKSPGEQGAFDGTQRRVKGQFYRIPVIQPGAFEVGIGDAKAERFDKVQLAARGRAESGDIAGIGWDLRVYENDAERVGRPVKIQLDCPCVSAAHRVYEK